MASNFLKYYCTFTDIFTFLVLPGQAGITNNSELEFDSNNFVNTDFSTLNGKLILVSVDPKNFLVQSVEIKGIFNRVLTTKQLEEVNKHNERINKLLNNINFVSKTNIDIPEDIFISKLNWELILASIHMNEIPLLIGPKGSGKTTIAKTIAKELSFDLFHKLDCSKLFRPKDSLIGKVHAKDGSTFLLESKFLKHYKEKEKNVLIFLDELSRTPQGASNYMLTITDEDSYLYVEELAEDIIKSSNVKFIAAANFGFEYVDTRTLDGAWMDRFVKIHMDLPNEDEEVELIKKKVNAKENEIRFLVQQANLCREEMEQIGTWVSTRQLIKLSKFLTMGFTKNEVIENLFLNIFSTDQKEIVNKILLSQI